MKPTKHTQLKFYKNTDSVDIDAKCIGLDIERDSIPSDVRDHLKRNRGLHIQIRHNGYRQTFAQACWAADLISAAPEMLEALEALVERASHFKDQGIKDIIAKQIDDAKNAIAKARGEK